MGTEWAGLAAGREIGLRICLFGMDGIFFFSLGDVSGFEFGFEFVSVVESSPGVRGGYM